MTMISLILPTSSAHAMTRQCVQSILSNCHGQDTELLVIDNGATPPYVPMGVEQVLRNATNQGWIVACNQGIRAATGELIVLMNDDVVLPTSGLARLVAPFTDPTVGMVGPVTNRIGAPQQQVVVPGDYTVERCEDVAHAIWEQFRGTVEEHLWLCGFCLAIRREVLDQIGLLDEQFGLGNYDDHDLTLRANMAGWRSVVARGCYVHHEGSSTFSRLFTPQQYAEQLEENRMRFTAKHHGVPTRTGFRAADRRNEEYRGVGHGMVPVERTVVPLSVCLIAKDEEQTLLRCLDSFLNYDVQIIVADTGSSDQTKAVAAAYGAEVYDVVWEDDFGKARTASLQYATRDWILWLDADAYVFPQDMEVLTSCFANPEITSRWNCFETDIIIDNTQSRWSLLTIVRNHLGARFEGIIHEQVVGEGLLRGRLPVAIHHYRKDRLPGDTPLHDRLYGKMVMERRDGMTLLYSGMHCKVKGQTRKARRLLREALDYPMADAIRSGVYLELGRLAKERGEWHRALDLLYQSMRWDSAWAEPWIDAAWCWDELHRWEQAIPLLEGVVQMPRPQGNRMQTAEESYTVVPRVNLARCYASVGQTDRAVALLRKAMAYGVRLPDIVSSLASLIVLPHPALASSPFPVAAQVVVYNEEDYLQATLTCLARVCDKILIMLSERPFNGVPVPPDRTPQIVRACVDRDPEKFSVVTGWWPSEQACRNEAVGHLQGYAVTLIVDGDEVYRQGDLTRLLQGIRDTYEESDVWRVRLNTYWKAPDWRIVPREPCAPVVAVKPRVLFQHLREPVACRNLLMPEDDVVAYHFSYAKTDAKIHEKLMMHPERAAFRPDWFETVWQAWTPAMENLHPSNGQCYRRAIREVLDPEIGALLQERQEVL